MDAASSAVAARFLDRLAADSADSGGAMWYPPVRGGVTHSCHTVQMSAVPCRAPHEDRPGSALLQLLGKHDDDAAGAADVGELVHVPIGRHAAQRVAAEFDGHALHAMEPRAIPW